LRQTKNSFLKEVFNGPVTGIESLVEKFFKNRGIMLTKLTLTFDKNGKVSETDYIFKRKESI
jgi:hypothetical protein